MDVRSVDLAEDSGRSESAEDNGGRKRSRKNTIEEKRRMRNSRKRRRRSKKGQVKELQAKVDKEHKMREECEQKLMLYKRMSRSFWERWQWEFGQRKEAMRAMIQRRGDTTISRCVSQLGEIDHNMLSDPIGAGSGMDLYIGRGSFGVVKLQLFRGIKVAVKELLPRTILSDVQHEAHILSRLCHPFLPYLFGVCTAVQPYRIVMQFHGIGEKPVSLTLSEAILKKMIVDEHAWLGLCAQILEAFQYLHEEANILHNDLTSSNILVTDSMTDNSTGNMSVQIVIIDFGKATGVNDGKYYHLSDYEKSDYTRRFPQMAPEVIDGVTRQTKWSDMYSVGGILYRIIDNHFFDRMPAEHRHTLINVARKCRCPQYSRRLSAQKALQYWQQAF